MKPSKGLIPMSALVGVGAALGLVLAALFAAPRVVLVEPAGGAVNVPASTRLRLGFSQPMNVASVRAHLSIDPPLPGRYLWEARELIFEPEHFWPSGGEVKVTLTAGVRSRLGLPMLRSKSWTFEVGDPRIAYLWPAEGPAQLYARTLGDPQETDALTEAPLGVIDYAIAGDGVRVAYSVMRPEGGTELRILNLVSLEDQQVLACQADHPCRSPSLSPDGRWMAFERQELALGEAGRLTTQRRSLWLLSLREAGPPVEVGGGEGSRASPLWSPTGWLSYYDDHIQAIIVAEVDLEGQTTPLRYIPSSLGLLGTWSPDGLAFIFPEIVFAQAASAEDGTPSETFYSHLYRVEIEDGRTSDISPGEERLVEDASPVFSPDGSWIAFTRKYLDPGRWTPGRQIWIMRADGSEARSLTEDPDALYSALVWSPDGKRLGFMRRNLATAGAQPEIGWLQVGSGDRQRLAQDGFLPAWIP
ncbi:MAG TPA: hypothetical protein ENL35_01765 [Chloroflexi bacterium]|nr:hypothetical protein [Chloroflexota bacterium]